MNTPDTGVKINVKRRRPRTSWRSLDLDESSECIIAFHTVRLFRKRIFSPIAANPCTLVHQCTLSASNSHTSMSLSRAMKCSHTLEPLSWWTRVVLKKNAPLLSITLWWLAYLSYFQYAMQHFVHGQNSQGSGEIESISVEKGCQALPPPPSPNELTPN